MELPALLERLVATGRIVDIMLLVLVLEVIVVQVLRRRGAGGIALLPMLLNLGAGGSLMLALRAVLVGSGTGWVVAFLLLSLVCHVADQAQRWERVRR